MKKPIWIVSLVLSVVLIGVAIFYIALPAISFRSSGFWWYLVIMSVIAGIITLIQMFREDNFWWAPAIPWDIAGLLLLVIAVISLCGSQLNSKAYRDALEFEESSFQDDFSDILESGKPVTMDFETAWSLGDRVLGGIPNASDYEVDGYTLIVYQGRPTWLGSLRYRTFHQIGIPGYILVDCETYEARFVETTEPIKIVPSALFGNNLKRHLRGQFLGYVFESSIFEVDDEGNPWWVTAVSESQAGLWGCRVADKAILTDPFSGESQVYELGNIPEWVENVLSLDYLMKRAQWHFTYLNGWWRGTFGDRIAKLSYAYKSDTFAGYTFFVASDGHVKVITGVTPSNKTESNIGFLTMDTATGKIQYYAIPGAEESSAQDIAEDLVRATGFKATFPVMQNVDGEPVYMMQMKGILSALIQRYALVDYRNRSIAYVGEDIETALEGFLKLKSVGSDVASTDSISGLIEEKIQAEIDGTTVFYYRIGDKLYKAPITISEYQVLIKTGDQVEFEYVDGEIRQVVQIKLD